MASQLETPRSRRAVLLAAVGAAVGTLTAAVGRPSTANAADGDAVLLGTTNTAASTTVLALPSSLSDPVQPPSPALRVESAGDGLAVAIEAHSREEYAIVADSIMGGVLGLSVNGYGVAGQSDNDVGVLGTSGVAVGVQGESTSGTGGFFRSKSGTALEVSGLARMSRSGRATVMAGRASVDIDLRAKGGLAGTPLCFANLMTYRQGTFVTAVRPNYPVSGKARIYLNRAVTGSTNVAWVVLNPPVPPTPPDPNGP